MQKTSNEWRLVGLSFPLGYIDRWNYFPHDMAMIAGKMLFSLLGLLLSLSVIAQQGSTARSMVQQGMVNVTEVDSTIHVSLMYSRADNFTGQVLYRDLREAYLHPKAAAALARAQRILKQQRRDLSLKVYDAARPMSVQQQMWNVVAGTNKRIYVSNPKNGGGLHNYGMAVDVTLCMAATGDTLDMGTEIDHLGHYAHITEEAMLVRSGIMSAQAKRNRELLRSVMCEAGFTALKSEWWHFNYITRAEARAHYRVIR